MKGIGLDQLKAEIASVKATHSIGRVVEAARGVLTVTGLTDVAAIGDLVEIGHQHLLGAAAIPAGGGAGDAVAPRQDLLDDTLAVGARITLPILEDEIERLEMAWAEAGSILRPCPDAGSQ